MTPKEKATIQAKISKRFLAIKKQQTIITQNLEAEIRDIKRQLTEKEIILKKKKIHYNNKSHDFVISECEKHNIEPKTINSIFNL